MTTIAILGATSHIAKGLTDRFLSTGTIALTLYARAPEMVTAFLNAGGWQGRAIVRDIREFPADTYDAVINCIGAGRPSQLQAMGASIFRITEIYDNLIIDYLHDHPRSLYLNLSSGAVYGTTFAEPANDNTTSSIAVNHLTTADWYGIAKLHAEAKHRALPDLRIIDIRVFAYFSRFIDLQARFLLTDAINCIREKRVLETGPENIVRDYLHPEDLHGLVMTCIEAGARNDVFDAFSREPIAKFPLLDLLAVQYGLRYNVAEHSQAMTVTGLKMNYFSTSTKAGSIGYSPRHTSLDCIREEMQFLLPS
jgi:nucleoside-diphosphate-sugar epimerase